LDVVERAQRSLAGRRVTVVFPEGDEERVQLAAARLRRDHGIECLLLTPATIGDEAALVAAYLANRPDTKPAIAQRLARKPLFHAGLLVRSGRADAMIAGAACRTGRVIEAALMTIGAASDVRTPSSCLVINVSNVVAEGVARTLLFADCAINVEPTAEVLADIGLASAHSMREFTGEEPRVAFLSFSTRGSAQHALVERVREAVQIARRRAPDLAIDGELQADAALSARAARLKIKDGSPVAGRANVLVFPDLNSANIGYKLVQYLGGAQALGPFLQGFARPVSDLSRGATVDDIINTALVTLARAAPRR